MNERKLVVGMTSVNEVIWTDSAIFKTLKLRETNGLT